MTSGRRGTTGETLETTMRHEPSGDSGCALLDRGLSRRTSFHAAPIRGYQTDASSKRPLRPYLPPGSRPETRAKLAARLKAASISVVMEQGAAPAGRLGVRSRCVCSTPANKTSTIVRHPPGGGCARSPGAAGGANRELLGTRTHAFPSKPPCGGCEVLRGSHAGGWS